MKNLKTILAVIVVLSVTSCETYYRMITTIDKKGKVQREIYAHGNEKFMNGDNSENPFLFELDSVWNIHRFDSVFHYNFFGKNEELNVKIYKEAASIEQFAQNIQCDPIKRALAAPQESFIKNNGWFYTKHSFKVVYNKLQYDIPISIDDYLSKEEQIVWTQGGICNYKIMNGTEMNEYLSEIGDNFWRWHGKNRFEICFESINKLNTTYNLDIDKEEIYKQTMELVKDETHNITPEALCNVLDIFYRTSYFSKLYNANSAIIDKDFEALNDLEKLIFNVISYEIVISGKIAQTNAPIIESNRLIWKINGMRLLFDNYTLTVEYRTVNYWGFGLSGLLVLVALCSISALFNKKRHFNNHRL